MNTSDYDGRTALHIAASEHDEALAHFLLSHGASVHRKDNFGRTPLMEAILNGNRATARLIYRTGGPLLCPPPQQALLLCQYVADEKLDAMQLLIECGGDVNARSLEGGSALHMGVVERKESVIAFLVSHGADVHMKDKHGRTALQEATGFDLASLLSQ